MLSRSILFLLKKTCSAVVTDDISYLPLPYTPCFHACKNSDTLSYTVSGTKIALEHAITNIGGGYDTTTSLYTAPISGTYYFKSTVLVQRVANASAEATFYRNGVNISERSLGYTYVSDVSDYDCFKLYF